MSKEVKILVGIVGAAILIAVLFFGFGKNEWGHSGFEIIANQGGWYVFGMVFFTIVAAVTAFLAIRHYNKTQKAGSTVIIFIVAAIFLAIGLGKGCTDKANDGVTGPGGRPAAIITK